MSIPKKIAVKKVRRPSPLIRSGDVLNKHSPIKKFESRTLTHVSESMSKTKHAVLSTMTQLITAAFGLVAALAWNDTIQSLVKQYFEAGDDIPAKVWYSVIVTLLAVIVTLWLGKLKER